MQLHLNVIIMKDLLNDLFSQVNHLITEYNDSKGNEVRYKVGEAFSNYYTTNKEDISRSTDEIEKALVVFYKENNLKSDKLKTDDFKKLTNWDKIKTAISDSLSRKYILDGYGMTNLGYMQQFYRKYRNAPESLDLANQLEWSHNVILLNDKLIEDERKFYLKEAIKKKWTVIKLKKEIKDETYDDFLATIENSKYTYHIESLFINNYKSLVQLTLKSPTQFLVFAGANATGKSSIFEAVEFLMDVAITKGTIAFDMFGGVEKVVNFNAQKKANNVETSLMTIMLELSFEHDGKKHTLDFGLEYDPYNKVLHKEFTDIPQLDDHIINSFSRIFIDNQKRADNKLKVFNKLWLDAANLGKILKNILEVDDKRLEINEWLQTFIPEIEKITVIKDVSGKEELQVIEKAYPNKPFTGTLISEGTFNIIALLTLFYQTDEPQFICIEEPEIGLNPAILKELVSFFREMTIKKRHHIWITTHSTTFVAELKETELIIVNKKIGETFLYPCKLGDFEGMKPDDAWMSNMLKGGGLPW